MARATEPGRGVTFAVGSACHARLHCAVVQGWLRSPLQARGLRPEPPLPLARWPRGERSTASTAKPG